ncbi:MAG: hypothetical protein AAGA50_15365 [Pseudomonadota bacterium]
MRSPDYPASANPALVATEMSERAQACAQIQFNLRSGGGWDSAGLLGTVLLQVVQTHPVHHFHQPEQRLFLRIVQLLQIGNLQDSLAVTVPGQEEIDDITDVFNSSISFRQSGAHDLFTHVPSLGELSVL